MFFGSQYVVFPGAYDRLSTSASLNGVVNGQHRIAAWQRTPKRRARAAADDSGVLA